MLILALDISKSRTGAALGRPGDRPAFDSVVGRDLSNASAIVKLGRWLIDLTRQKPPIDLIVYEAMINPGAFIGEWNEMKRKVELRTNPDTTIALAKMTGIVEFVGDMREIPTQPANIFTVRKVFLGDGRPKHPKEQAEALCRILGWAPANLDEADAGAVFYYAACQEDPRNAQVATPMQQAKAASKVNGATIAGIPVRLDDLGQPHIDRKDAANLFATGRTGR